MKLILTQKNEHLQLRQEKVNLQVQDYTKTRLHPQTDKPMQSSEEKEEKFENCTRVNVSNNFDRKF